VETLVGRLSPPKTSSKHHSYFEFVENKDKKKKKLEYKVTNNKEPPPGFTFVPVGNPKLTAACKELSRERDAMIFIVSACTSYAAYSLMKLTDARTGLAMIPLICRIIFIGLATTLERS